MSSEEESAGDKQAHFSPNQHGVEYEDINVGGRVELNSAVTEGIAEGNVEDKQLKQSVANESKYYAEITVRIDPEYLHSGTLSAEEWAELPQITEVLD
jgi:hypothetical protein